MEPLPQKKWLVLVPTECRIERALLQSYAGTLNDNFGWEHITHPSFFQPQQEIATDVSFVIVYGDGWDFEHPDDWLEGRHGCKHRSVLFITPVTARDPNLHSTHMLYADGETNRTAMQQFILSDEPMELFKIIDRCIQRGNLDLMRRSDDE